MHTRPLLSNTFTEINSIFRQKTFGKFTLEIHSITFSSPNHLHCLFLHLSSTLSFALSFALSLSFSLVIALSCCLYLFSLSLVIILALLYLSDFFCHSYTSLFLFHYDYFYSHSLFSIFPFFYYISALFLY